MTTQEKTKQEESISALLRIALNNMRQLKGHWYVLVPLLLIYVVTVVSEPYFYKIFVDALSGAFGSGSDMGAATTKLISIAIGWIVLVLVSLASFTLYDFLINAYINADWEESMRKVTAHILRLPIEYHLSVNLWERQKLVERGNDALWNAWWNLCIQIIPSAIIFVALLILGLSINVTLTIISLVVLPIWVMISATVGARAHERQKAASELWDSVYGRFSDALTNLFTIRILARESVESHIIDDRMKTAATAQFSIRKLWCFLWAGGKLLALIGKMTVVIAGAFMILHGRATVWELFLFVALAGAIYWPLQSLEWSYREMVKSLAEYSKLQKILHKPLEIDSGTKTFWGLKESIVYENISFQYPDTERKIIDWAQVTIPKGKIVAFVGHTGSGKTTLANLLTRFYTPNSGKILVDGVDIRDFSLASYRAKFAAVFQDTTLFNDTIEHNLAYVRDDVTQDEIIKACRDANILDFIQNLPDGFKTIVWERGLKLSGGEKQRIAIARAILSNREILVLDEATSALDAQTEAIIKQSLDRLMVGRTSIVIAHRLSTIINADIIYLLDKWAVVASGNHQQLYVHSKEYQAMVNYQKDGFIQE